MLDQRLRRIFSVLLDEWSRDLFMLCGDEDKKTLFYYTMKEERRLCKFFVKVGEYDAQNHELMAAASNSWGKVERLSEKMAFALPYETRYEVFVEIFKDHSNRCCTMNAWPAYVRYGLVCFDVLSSGVVLTSEFPTQKHLDDFIQSLIVARNKAFDSELISKVVDDDGKEVAGRPIATQWKLMEDGSIRPKKAMMVSTTKSDDVTINGRDFTDILTHNED